MEVLSKTGLNRLWDKIKNYMTWGHIIGKPSTFTPSSHTHTKSQITDFPSSLPASDVYSWAKASSKPGYSWGEISSKPFNWNGQSGQPSWLWGSNDGSNYYVWNPSNFSVNYAKSAGNADTVDGYHASSFASSSHNHDSTYLKLSGGTVSGSITATQGFYESDSKLKKNIQDITYTNIPRLYQFDWKKDNSHSYGFIAQDLEKDYPELVRQSGDHKVVDYNAALCLTVAILSNKVDELNSRLNSIEHGE